MKYCKSYYVDKSNEVADAKLCLRQLKSLYGAIEAGEFRPRKLKLVRESMIHQDCCRNYINEQIKRLKRIFRWCVEEELIPGSVYHNLKSVESLKRGKTHARESKPIEPIDIVSIDKFEEKHVQTLAS